jgi:ribosomal-protein-alanine N-acetyltransferase
MLPETFHTARLKLRPIVPEDAGPIFDGYAQDTTVTRFVIWRPHRSRSDTEAYIAQCIATPPDVSRTYVLTDRTDGDVRGTFALRLAAPHRLDCGYALARAWWGRGLMTEVLTEVVNWALSQPLIFRDRARSRRGPIPSADIGRIDRPARTMPISIDADNVSVTKPFR